MDVILPGDTVANVVTQHVTRNVVRAMMAVSMLLLCRSPVYCKEMANRLERGIPRRGRDAFDAAGKFVLSMKLLSLGVQESDVYVDSAQAAGHAAQLMASFLDQENTSRSRVPEPRREVTARRVEMPGHSLR